MNLLRSRFLLLFISFFVGSNSHSSIINYAKMQFAGEIGFLSIGLGKNITKNYSLEYFHGFVPEDIGGHEIETFCIKNIFKLYRYDKAQYVMNFTAGINIYHVTGLEYQTSRHSSFPEEYYRMGAIRGLLNFGFDLEYKKNTIYAEYGLNDIVLINYLNNPKTIKLQDYLSIALGYGRSF